MKEPQMPVPSQFKALFNWLKLRRGLDLFGRINFTRGFYVGGIAFTPDDARILRKILDDADAPARNPRNKHPAKGRDAPVTEAQLTMNE